MDRAEASLQAANRHTQHASHETKNFSKVTHFKCKCNQSFVECRLQVIQRSFIHSVILDISIVPLQVHYYSDALPSMAPNNGS